MAEKSIFSRNGQMINRLAALLLLLLPACTLEGELEHRERDAPGPIVVEGRISLGEGATVVLVRAASLEYPTYFPPVTDARAILMDDRGNSEVLIHLGAGHYRSFAMQGEPGAEYALSVEAGGEMITGLSVMPAVPIRVDSAVHRHVRIESGFLRSQAVLYFQDPPGQADFAWVRLTTQENGRQIKFYFFYEDKGFDGRYQEFSMQLNDWLIPGESARVEFFQVEEQVFHLFKEILETTGTEAAGQQGEGEVFLAPPENLSANLSGRTPGYFFANVRFEELLIAP